MGATPSQTKRFVVVAGGEPWTGPPPRLGVDIHAVIAADSGLHLALELDLPVAVLIGDLDSVSPEAVAEAVATGTRVVRYPAEKDATDLELAMDLASSEGATDIVVIGGAGGRLSHLLGIAGLLASDRYIDAAIKWLLPEAAVYVANVKCDLVIEGGPGDLVSLIAIGGPATGITTTGLKWELTDDTLHSSASRGISNVFTTDSASVHVDSGTLLAIHERPEL